MTITLTLHEKEKIRVSVETKRKKKQRKERREQEREKYRKREPGRRLRGEGMMRIEGGEETNVYLEIALSLHGKNEGRAKRLEKGRVGCERNGEGET